MTCVRKTKHFVENKSEALLLAAAISAAQEEKSANKVEKRHRAFQARADRTTSRKSASKTKLHELKAWIAAERVRAKKEKGKLRKQNTAAVKDTGVIKRVSFAMPAE